MKEMIEVDQIDITPKEEDRLQEESLLRISKA